MGRKRFDPERDALKIHQLFHNGIPMDIKAINTACDFCNADAAKLPETYHCPQKVNGYNRYCHFQTNDRQERVSHIDFHYNQWAMQMGYDERRDRKLADLKTR